MTEQQRQEALRRVRQHLANAELALAEIRKPVIQQATIHMNKRAVRRTTRTAATF